jgi:hypothetical protein
MTALESTGKTAWMEGKIETGGEYDLHGGGNIEGSNGGAARAGRFALRITTRGAVAAPRIFVYRQRRP